LERAVAEELHGVVGAPHEPARLQRDGVDLVARGEDVEVADVHDLQRRLGAGEPALGQAHDQPRASAFPARAAAVAGAALLALLPASGGLAPAAAHAAADALAGLLRPRRRP